MAFDLLYTSQTLKSLEGTQGSRQDTPRGGLLRTTPGCSLPVILLPSRVLSRTSHDGRGHGICTAPAAALSWANGASSQWPQCPIHSCR